MSRGGWDVAVVRALSGRVVGDVTEGMRKTPAAPREPGGRISFLPNEKLLLPAWSLVAKLFEVLLHHLLGRLWQALYFDRLRSLLNGLFDVTCHFNA